MLEYRKYGNPPFKIALIHGGPGAAGDLAPFAKEISKEHAVLELLQTKSTIYELIQELHQQIIKNAQIPVILIGHSWGAWLSILFASKYERCVKKLILVGCPPFNNEHSKNILNIRLKRLLKDERIKLDTLLLTLQNENENKNKKNLLFMEIGKLMHKADSYKPLNSYNNLINYQYNIFQKVWVEADELRGSGKLVEYAKNIKLPVVAIHGNYDPHPGKSIKNDLPEYFNNFNYFELDKCGHEPWNEVYAKNQFYEILFNEICCEGISK